MPDDDMVILTGPTNTTVETGDGTRYDTTAPVLRVRPQHHAEVLHGIHDHMASFGHPLLPDFAYTDELRAEVQAHSDEAVAAHRSAQPNIEINEDV